MQGQIVRTVLSVFAIGLVAACASSREISAQEQLINEIAVDKARNAKFPVLVPLPSAQEVVGEGIPVENAVALKGAAQDLSTLSAIAIEEPDDLNTDETVAELRAMIAALKAGQTAKPLVVDVDALGFPTPPPLEP